MYYSNTVCIESAPQRTKSNPCNIRVKKGFFLSPNIFNVVINEKLSGDIFSHTLVITTINSRLYTDYLVIVLTPEGLQHPHQSLAHTVQNKDSEEPQQIKSLNFM